MTLSHTSPQRLLEGGGTDYERQLLAASDGYAPSAAAAQRMAAALRASAAGTLITPPAVPAARLTSAVRLLKPALGVIGGGILAALMVSQWPAQRDTPSAPQLAPITAPAPELVVASAPPVATLPEPQVLDRQQIDTRHLDTTQVEPKAERRRIVERRTPPVKKQPASRAQYGGTNLAAELRAIENIQSLLGWGQTQQAEAALRDYRASFPHGELALEADLSSVDVALAQGDVTRARALARDLLERPGAIRYRARLSPLLETTAQPQGSNRRPR